MTAPRAIWKGFLKFGSVACAVKLIGATSESEKIHLRVLNRKTGQPVKSAYIDDGTEKTVESEDQVKGYQTDKGDYVMIEPDEIKQLKLSSEHTLEVDNFVPLDSIDQRYLEKPYHVIPADAAAVETFAVVRDAMDRRKVAGRACIVLYQRGREVVIQSEGKGLLMTTLRNHNEMVGEKSVFEGLSKLKADAEMIEVAELLIDKKAGSFDPSRFDDTYENALVEMIKAKQAGKKPPKAAPKPKENVVNLADILRKSLEKEGIGKGQVKRPAAKPKKSAA